jgi:hypothetical protein
VFAEQFRLVAENLTYFGTDGMFWNITVNPKTYAYDYVTHTPPPATMQPGSRSQVKLTLKNTGNFTWRKDGANPLRLSTARPNDRASVFANNTWLAPQRLAMTESEVGPGQNANFTFDFVAPNSGGTYREYFQPVIEGFDRIAPDRGLYFETTVPGASASAPDFGYDYVGSTAYPTIAKNGTSVLKLQLRNNGRQTWRSDGANPVRLATDRPQDRGSGFASNGSSGFNSGWLSANRIKLTRNLTDGTKNVGTETSVGSGEVAEFEFTIKGNPPVGKYNEYFRPVVEGITFLPDRGIFWNITIQ